MGIDLAAVTARRNDSRREHLRPAGQRPPSSARGLRDVGPYAEVLDGLHQVAIRVESERRQHLVGRLEAAGVEHVLHREVSVYVRDPDGARLELIADPLGEMYGDGVL